MNVVINWFIVHWKKYFDNQNYIHAILIDNIPSSTAKHWNLRQWSPPRLGQRRPQLWGSKGRNISASPPTIQIGTSTIRLSWYHFSPLLISLWALRSQKSRRTFRESRYNGGINAEGMEGPRRQEVWQDIHHHRVIFKRPPTKSCRCKKNPRAMFRDTRRSTKCRI